MEVGTSFRPEQAEETDETEERVSMINVAPAKKKRKMGKTNVMLTWASTKSIVMTEQGHKPIKMHSEVMVHLLLRSSNGKFNFIHCAKAYPRCVCILLALPIGFYVMVPSITALPVCMDEVSFV